MPSGSSHSRNDDLQLQLELLWLEEGGTLERLPCPMCHEHSVDVLFTHPAPTEYRTWFLCRNCRFQFRVQNSGRPKHYTEGRVDEDLEEYDRDLLKKRRL